MDRFVAETDAYRQHSVQDLISLKGKTAVITGKMGVQRKSELANVVVNIHVAGGARGLGLAIARGCVELGANVAALDVLEEPSEEFSNLTSDLDVTAKYYRFVRRTYRTICRALTD